MYVYSLFEILAKGANEQTYIPMTQYASQLGHARSTLKKNMKEKVSFFLRLLLGIKMVTGRRFTNKSYKKSCVLI